MDHIPAQFRRKVVEFEKRFGAPRALVDGLVVS